MKKEDLFYILSIIGSVIIMIISIQVVDNPFETIKGTLDYPLFLYYSAPYIFALILVLYIIFHKEFED